MGRPSSPRKRAGVRVRGRAPAPEGVAAARRALARQRVEQAILRAADKVFTSEEPRPRVLDEIARRASTSVEIVKELFTSVERLFAAVVLEQIDKIDESIRRATKHAGSAREQLEAMVLVRAAAALERPRFAKLLFPGANPPPEVQRGYARLRGRARAAFAEGIRTGELRRELVDPVVLAAMFDGGLRTWLVERVLRSGVHPDDAAVQGFVAALLDGVGAPRRGRRTSRTRPS